MLLKGLRFVETVVEVVLYGFLRRGFLQGSLDVSGSSKAFRPGVSDNRFQACMNQKRLPVHRLVYRAVLDVGMHFNTLGCFRFR